MAKSKIAVIGAGIIGTSTALLLAEQLENHEITIIAEKLSPNTTSDVSAGLLIPIYVEKTEIEKIIKWYKETLNFLSAYYWSSEADKTGISLISLYSLFNSDDDENELRLFSQYFIGYRQLSEYETKLFGEWKYGSQFTTYITECVKFLPFLIQKFKSKNGKVMEKKVNNLKELIGIYDIVINCSGIGAHTLVSDQKVIPYRGQLVRVRAPWIKHGIWTENRYILPNADTVILGRTKQIGDWSTDISNDDTNKLIEDCKRLFPSLVNAQVVNVKVGLRPGRQQPRIETEVLTSDDNTSNDELFVVHNYGHGSSGMTLFWGCAQHVLQLVRNYIELNN